MGYPKEVMSPWIDIVATEAHTRIDPVVESLRVLASALLPDQKIGLLAIADKLDAETSVLVAGVGTVMAKLPDLYCEFCKTIEAKN